MKTNKSGSFFWWLTLLPCLHLHIWGNILKISLVSLVSKSVILCLGSLTCNLLKVFSLLKFLILSTGLRRCRLPVAGCRLPANTSARLQNRLSIKNLTTHYHSQFCVSFNFCIDQKAQRPQLSSWSLIPSVTLFPR